MRSRTTTLALGTGFVLVSLTSLPLLLDPVFDRRYFWFVVVHLGLGLALLPLYYWAVGSHLKTILGRYRTWMIFILLVPFTFLGGIGPPFVSPWHNPLSLPVALLSYALYRHLSVGGRIFGRRPPPLRLFEPLDPEENRLTVWSGVGALIASWLILHTGFALLVADFKFANDKYFLHGPISMALFPVLALHFAFWGRRYGRRPTRTTQAILVAIAFTSAALFAMSLYKNLVPLDHLKGEDVMRIATRGASIVPAPPVSEAALAVIADSKPCQACHDEVAAGWSISSHRFAGLNKLYLALLPEVAADLGGAGVRFCDNCHDPVLALEGRLDRRFAPETLARSEGVSCKVCHFLDTDAHSAGNGDVPLVLVKGLGFPGAIPNASNMSSFGRFQVSIDSRLHIRSVRRPAYQKPGACRPCHVVEIPARFNGARDLELTPLFPSFEKWEHHDQVGCMECHMTNVDRDRQAYRQWDHRFLGANQALSLLVPDEYRERAKGLEPITESYLRGKMPNAHDQEDIPDETPIVANLLWGGTHLPIDIGVERRSEPRGLGVAVTTSSVNIGHDFPVDLADQADVWLEVRVLDAEGEPVFESGGLDGDHHLAAGTRTLGGEFLDRSGVPLSHHEIWRLAEIRDRRFIAPGGKHEERFEVPLSGDERTPLTVTARWMYRRANQPIADWIFSADGTTFPVSELSRAERVVG